MGRRIMTTDRLIPALANQPPLSDQHRTNRNFTLLLSPRRKHQGMLHKTLIMLILC
jgi:hypothetical protein